MKFSIITVCLNAGKDLLETVGSVLSQTEKDYELLIKDGGSTDGFLEQLPVDEHIRLVSEKDSSIYDAMNQAVKLAKGDYYLFLNCGDLLVDQLVLEKVWKCIRQEKADIVYGDQYLRKQKCVVPSPSKLTDFICYRNIPCHQVCFYHRKLFEKRGYDLSYPGRADYEHFLWCKYHEKASFYSMGIPVSAYLGDGFSETKENMKKAGKEHKAITQKYIGGKCFWYHLAMILSLQPLRKKINDSKKFSGLYQKIKKLFR